MNHFTTLIYDYGLLAIFFIILIEYACFPISSEIVLPFSGAFASFQHISYFLLLPISVAAGLLGTSICYIIGRYGGAAVMNRIIDRFPKAQKGISYSQEKFHQYGTLAVALGRLIPICRTYIAFIAGAAGQSPLSFLASSCIGITLWNAVLIGLGYFLRTKWSLAIDYYTRYKDIIGPFLLFLSLTILVKVRKKKMKG